MNWKLLGKYVDPSGKNLEQAALRELKKETGSIKVKNMTYIIRTKVDDWRYRNMVHKTIITVFGANM